MGIGGGGGGGGGGDTNKPVPKGRPHAEGFVFDRQTELDQYRAEADNLGHDPEAQTDAQGSADYLQGIRNAQQRKFDEAFYKENPWVSPEDKAAADAKKDGLPGQVSIDDPEIQKARDDEIADAAAAVGRDETIIATPVVVDPGLSMSGGTDGVAVAGGRGTETGAQAPVVRDPGGGRGAPADAAGGGRNVGFGTSDPDRGQGRGGRGRGRDQRTGGWRRPPRGGRGRPKPDKALIVDTGVVTTGKTLLGQ